MIQPVARRVVQQLVAVALVYSFLQAGAEAQGLTTLSREFAVEVGIPSPPTLESFQSFLPKADQWPISDAWAYHDWHPDGNGDVAPFMQAMIDEFSAPSSLADFDRKTQLLNYVDRNAVSEGMNPHLWASNSGRLLWMTQAAWPSSVWQMFSHDYDAQAWFYAVTKAAEPIHIQMNLPDHDVIVVNHMEQALTTATIHPSAATGGESHTTVSLTNNGKTPAITAEPTLVDALTGERILPAYYSDNYVSLLPGESKIVFHRLSASSGTWSNFRKTTWMEYPVNVNCGTP